MKITYQSNTILYNNKHYYREVFSNGAIGWSINDSYIKGDIKADLENEYQKLLIPTKTLNPSEEKGFVNLWETPEFNFLISSMKMSGLKEIQLGNSGYKLQANGEKPEEVNPVGQINFIFKKEELLNKLSKLDGAEPRHGEASFGYSFKLKDGRDLIIGQSDDDVADDHICWISIINKPRTTDKEQPSIWKLECKKRNSNYRDVIRHFNGTVNELVKEIDKINYGNYSYDIVNYSKVDDTV